MSALSTDWTLDGAAMNKGDSVVLEQEVGFSEFIPKAGAAGSLGSSS